MTEVKHFREAFRDAFKYWSDVTPLTFEISSPDKADIKISFGRYGHGKCPYHFDGEGIIIAIVSTD
jgi:hypothetical protein